MVAVTKYLCRTDILVMYSPSISTFFSFVGKEKKKKKKDNDDDEEEVKRRQQVPRLYLSYSGESRHTSRGRKWKMW